ncbi:MAG: hypothetical protein IID33_15195 [Planctomycetes bacterium]|nr:hypothetical protein [Planctomycetota bacterium]
MHNDRFIRTLAPFALGTGLLLGGCGFFDPSFLNTFTGGIFPRTPGPNAAFVLVLGDNDTSRTVEFIVTIERNVLDLDDTGAAQIDENGQFLTEPVRETVRLCTPPGGGAQRLGTLFACGESPVTLVGLGENLLPTDRHVLVGGDCGTSAPGSGITVPNLNPLEIAVGNFNCGDTIIFQALEDSSVAGGISVRVLLLPGSEQPGTFSGPNTFANLTDFLDAQRRERE